MAKVTISQFADKIEKEADDLARAIKIKMFSQAITNTRVDTGRLAGNWQLSNGSPIKSTVDRLDPTYSSGLSALQSTKGLGTSYLTNNLDYAAIWNERDGIIDGVRAQMQNVVNSLARAKR